MEFGKAVLVLLLLVGIIVGANAMMFFLLRGARGGAHFNWLGLDLTKLSKKEDDSLAELNRRVRELQGRDQTDQENKTE
jgi:hypothetical protein